MIQQNDNDIINVPVTSGNTGETIPASSFADAKVLISTFACVTLFEGTLNNEITVSGDNFVIDVPPIDSNGPVNIEMRVWDNGGRSNTIFSTTLTIDQTKISRIQ